MQIAVIQQEILYFKIQVLKKCRVDSSGRLLINATSTAFSDKFYINSDAYATGGWRVGTAATTWVN